MSSGDVTTEAAADGRIKWHYPVAEYATKCLAKELQEFGNSGWAKTWREIGWSVGVFSAIMCLLFIIGINSAAEVPGTFRALMLWGAFGCCAWVVTDWLRGRDLLTRQRERTNRYFVGGATPKEFHIRLYQILSDCLVELRKVQPASTTGPEQDVFASPMEVLFGARLGDWPRQLQELEEKRVQDQLDQSDIARTVHVMLKERHPQLFVR